MSVERVETIFASERGVLGQQVGGTHYAELPIQPAEFCQANGLRYCESAVVRYVSRHRQKGGAQDLRKAIHCLQMLLAMEYGEEGEA